jgi:hypothetical protein
VAALQRSAPERATILVSDRPGTIAAADEVVVLDGGVVAARGAHHELLADDERYRRLASAADVDELGAAARASHAPEVRAAPDGAPARATRRPARAPSREPAGSGTTTRRAYTGVGGLLPARAPAPTSR